MRLDTGRWGGGGEVEETAVGGGEASRAGHGSVTRRVSNRGRLRGSRNATSGESRGAVTFSPANGLSSGVDHRRSTS